MRCNECKETSFHRAWECSGRKHHEIYDLSDEFVAKAHAGREAEARFWVRGLIPSPWLEVPEPIQEEDWTCHGIDGFGEACFPH
eukprot:9103596-Pyramimonas_sp.AAC.1